MASRRGQIVVCIAVAVLGVVGWIAWRKVSSRAEYEGRLL